MIRTRTNKRPNAILCADMHLREDSPVCRKDDFQGAQWKKVEIVRSLQQQYNCPVLHAGDLFHHWKPSPQLLSTAIMLLPEQFYTIYGQHDLPQHNLELSYKCGIRTLEAAGVTAVLSTCHWGQTPEKPSRILSERKVLVWHKMTYMGNPPYPGCPDPTANVLLRKYPQFDLILTGDNHIPFTTDHNGRLLVNPGSLTRQKADQVDHKPRVYLWYADSNTVEPYYLPIDPDAVSREHITKDAERDERIEAFISRLDGEWDVGLSFEENLEKAIKANKISKEIIDIIYKAIES